MLLDEKINNYMVREGYLYPLNLIVSDDYIRERAKEIYKGMYIPTLEELENLAELLEVNIGDICISNNMINPYVYVNNFVYAQFYSFRPDIFKTFRAKEMIEQYTRTNKEALSELDFGTVFMLIEDRFKPFAFFDVYYNELLKGDKLYELFKSIYTKIDYGFELFEGVGIIRELFDLNPDKSFYNELPCDDKGFVTIYRGEGSKSSPLETAFSWTLDINTAYFFAYRFNKEDAGVLYKAKTYYANIKEFLKDRNEMEVIVFPEDVIGAEIVESYKPIMNEDIKGNNDIWGTYKRNLKNIKREYYFNPDGIHGITHIKRVLLLALTLSYLEGINQEDLEVIIKSCLIHDIGRTNDEEDKSHGYKSYKKALELGVCSETDKDINLIRFIVTNHCLSDGEFQKNLKREGLSGNDKERLERLATIMFDSDRLDRVRLHDLDYRYLKSSHSLALARHLAKQLLRDIE